MEDTSVLEVGDFWVSVKSAGDGQRLAAVGLNVNILTDLEFATLHVDVELFASGKTVSIGVLASLELHGEDSHTDEVGTMDTLVAFSNDGFHTLEIRTFGGPIARGSGTVFLSSKDDGVDASIFILVGSIKDSHLFSCRNVDGGRTSLGDHLVDKTDVCEGTTSHDGIISTARSIRVVVLGWNTSLFQISCSW